VIVLFSQKNPDLMFFYDSFRRLGIKDLNLYSLKTILTKPKGQGWANLIKFVFDNTETNISSFQNTLISLLSIASSIKFLISPSSNKSFSDSQFLKLLRIAVGH
jgi:hypothetical protein